MDSVGSASDGRYFFYLYQTTTSFCNTTLKYAKASVIRVELVYQRSHFLLRIKDNGQGFIMNYGTVGGFGLLGMTERAERIGAQLTIKSAPGQGTEIVVSVASRNSS